MKTATGHRERGESALPVPHAPACAASASAAVRALLGALGVPPSEVASLDLPEAIRGLAALVSGYDDAVPRCVAGHLYDDPSDEPILVRDLPFESLSRRYLVPFRGRAHVAYLPDGRALDGARLGLLVDGVARRLQSPGRLTEAIARAVEETVGARGVAVWLEVEEPSQPVGGALRTQRYLGRFRTPLWRERLEAMR